MVQLELVWRRGLQLHFPLAIMRVTLESCACARRLILSGAVSEAVLTLSAILAGGSFATDALLVVLIGPCDELALEYPSADLCLFVDDLTIHVTGMVGQVADLMQAVVSSCIDKLETELQLKVSRGKRWQLDEKGKTIVVASSAALARTLEPKMRAMGVATRKQAKMLGIDFAGGRRVVRSVQKSRLKAVVNRRHRYRRLGKVAAARLLKTGAA